MENIIQLRVSLADIPRDATEIVINIDNNILGMHSDKVNVGRHTTLFSFFRDTIQQFRQDGQTRTAETYLATLNSFKRFRDNVDIDLSDLNYEVIDSYANYLRHRNVVMNTLSFYMRRLRALYNRAVNKDMTIDRHPFRNAYTGNASTQKRALNADTLRLIKDWRPTSDSAAMARDMFLFSFYAQGMPLIDMAYLKKDNIANGRLTYQRHKTGQTISMPWNDTLRGIAERYPGATNLYLLPIITKLNGKERNQLRWAQAKINNELHGIGRTLNLPQPLTFYAARHSWASIATQLHVPINVVSQCMGHASESTTRIYIKAMDTEEADKANVLVKKSLG